jgi:hypothetical protein
MKRPWFHVIEIIEPRGRSIADIALSVARARRIDLDEMRSNTCRLPVQRARHEAYRTIRRERPEVSSSLIANYFRVEASGVRRVWRRESAA